MHISAPAYPKSGGIQIFFIFPLFCCKTAFFLLFFFFAVKSPECLVLPASWRRRRRLAQRRTTGITFTSGLGRTLFNPCGAAAMQISGAMFRKIVNNHPP